MIPEVELNPSIKSLNKKLDSFKGKILNVLQITLCVSKTWTNFQCDKIVITCSNSSIWKTHFLLLETGPVNRMPHKIGFVVVSSSGHEDGFSARELMIHAPTVSGWRSPRWAEQGLWAGVAQVRKGRWAPSFSASPYKLRCQKRGRQWCCGVTCPVTSRLVFTFSLCF